MNLPLQRMLLTLTCAGVAIYVAFGLAQGEYGWAVLLGGTAAFVSLHRICQVRVDALLLGAVVLGYYVGNRGFAQQTVFPGLPLFPAELALGAGAVWLIFQTALERRLPVRKDPLHLLLTLWIVFGLVRVVFDIPRHGILALRDFATIYYAGFFFIGQNIEAGRDRRFLRWCLLIGSLVLPVLYPLFLEFQSFFAHQLTWRNIPLIYLKGDVAVPLAGAGIFLLHFDPALRRQRWTMPVALLLVLFVFASNSRAAQLGVLVVDAVLLFRRSRLPWIHLGVLALAALLLAVLAYSGQARWAEDKLRSTGERLMSMVDVTGTRQYQSESLADKSDNNRFRLVWWRVVAEETLRTNPTFGLGFGYDLARGFVREYDAGIGEDFSARSPHNVVFTVFGRLGLAGLALAAAVVVIMARHTLRALQREDETAAYWCMAWVILVSACFGVVLEGPMGAVPFWVLVGLAYRSAARESAAEKAAANANAALPA
jgi:O-antigen ligase